MSEKLNIFGKPRTPPRRTAKPATKPRKPKPPPSPRDRQIKALQKRCRNLERTVEALQDDIGFILACGEGRWW